MADTVPDAVVQIAEDAIRGRVGWRSASARVVAALARRYAFVEHDRLAALEAAAAESFLFDWYAARKPAEEVLRLAQSLASLFPSAAPGPAAAEDAAFAELVQLGQEIEGGGK